MIFLLSHWVFAHPALSRVLYQAVLTEREDHAARQAPAGARCSGASRAGTTPTATYWAAMLHPASLWLILVGGLLITIRNQATERLFGLDWKSVGRYSTGVPLEEVERKRAGALRPRSRGMEPPARAPQMERMYTIRIRAGKDAILRQLGAFGDPDRQYLKPRFVQITPHGGSPNEVGTVIRYDVALLRLSFSVVLEKVVAGALPALPHPRRHGPGRHPGLRTRRAEARREPAHDLRGLRLPQGEGAGQAGLVDRPANLPEVRARRGLEPLLVQRSSSSPSKTRRATRSSLAPPELLPSRLPPNDSHRAGGVVENLVTDRSEQDAREISPSPAPHDQQDRPLGFVQ